MKYIEPNWSAPKHIGALTTTRNQGFSEKPYHGLNLALHAGDNASCVRKNREFLVKSLKLPAEPEWLIQTHSNLAVTIDKEKNREADASITQSTIKPLVILTADCLPILVTDKTGTEIAAIHAGWRGLSQGIIENTIRQMNKPAQELMAWIGPSICKNCFETGYDVVAHFSKSYSDIEQYAQQKKNKWFVDLKAIATKIMNNNGIDAVYDSGICTFEQEKEMFSYRRDGETGRMASLIWFKQE